MKNHIDIRIDAELIQFFPKTTDEITRRTDELITSIREQLDAFKAIAKDKRTFENTALTFDSIVNQIKTIFSLWSAVESLYHTEEMREAAHHNILKLNAFSIDHIWYNQAVYSILQSYSAQEQLQKTPERVYFIKELMNRFKRNGVSLPADKQERLRDIEKELAGHQLAFGQNIAIDARAIVVPLADLAGVSAHFIHGLRREGPDHVVLGLDYPTYFHVIQYCSVEHTRHSLWQEFVNRAYPANYQELSQIIALRDERATLLGYDSFAAFDLDNQMAEKPEVVEAFLETLFTHASQRAQKEIEKLQSLSADLTMDSSDTIEPWNIAYLKNEYKKRFLSVDEEVIEEYFPLEHTLDMILEIYRDFLGLNFIKRTTVGLWDAHVKTLDVYDGEHFIGTLLLDLFPRPGKFTHACYIGIILAQCPRGEKRIPALNIVVANFPWPQHGKPALVPRSEVLTLFHEMGHAFHGFLGATELSFFSGTEVKDDFVELPSQMLEEWMWEPAILKRVSKHYESGQQLPDALIEKLAAVKRWDMGTSVVRQIYYSLESLRLFGPGAYKDLDEINRELAQKYLFYLTWHDADHSYASFGHLTDYASKYYGYLWSKVFAYDLFAVIKREGLTNPEIGKRYKKEILSRGGSAHPKELLRNFLQRDPSEQAFISALTGHD